MSVKAAKKMASKAISHLSKATELLDSAAEEFEIEDDLRAMDMIAFRDEAYGLLVEIQKGIKKYKGKRY